MGTIYDDVDRDARDDHRHDPPPEWDELPGPAVGVSVLDDVRQRLRSTVAVNVDENTEEW